MKPDGSCPFCLQTVDYRRARKAEQLREVGEEPLRLMAHVAVNDLPWSDIVTADYTMADEYDLGHLYEIMERTTDRAESVATVIQNIVVKHA